MLVLISLGIVFLAAFSRHIRARERAHPEALLSLSLFRVRMSNLGLVTQNIQWLLVMGTAFVVSVFLQVVRSYRATTQTWCSRRRRRESCLLDGR